MSKISINERWPGVAVDPLGGVWFRSSALQVAAHAWAIEHETCADACCHRAADNVVAGVVSYLLGGTRGRLSNGHGAPPSPVPEMPR